MYEANKAQRIMVPNPDGSGRWCVWDPVARAYVPGGINVSEKVARQLITLEASDWRDLATKNGWTPPGEPRRNDSGTAGLELVNTGHNAGSARGHETRVSPPKRSSVRRDTDL